MKAKAFLLTYRFRDGKCVYNQLLVLYSGWSLLDNGHQSDMGDQDSVDVTSEQESNFE